MKAYEIKTSREYCNEYLIIAESASEALNAFLSAGWHKDGDFEYNVESVKCLGEVSFARDIT